MYVAFFLTHAKKLQKEASLAATTEDSILGKSCFRTRKMAPLKSLSLP